MRAVWTRLHAGWRMRQHVTFARLVAMADTERSPGTDADAPARHVAACPRCAAALREIRVAIRAARTTIGAPPSETSRAVEAVRARLLHTIGAHALAYGETDEGARGGAGGVARGRARASAAAGDAVGGVPPRLLVTEAGARVADALAPWLGDNAARALLHHVRAGERVRRDVLQAVASPLTAFLGEDAGRALAIQISRLAESREEPTPPGEVCA